MINNFEIIIGIETHVVLNTKTKLFSSSKNAHNHAPNTLVNFIDLGLPGALPNPNPAAIKKAIWLGLSLNAEINYQNICFDRKNYYYLDLPKGYQITQQYFPIGRNGHLIIDGKKVHIERFHLEEDTAKQIVLEDKILLDYNRSGSPLIEIVTKPTIHSADQAAEYLRKLIRVLKFNNISDAKLEDGSMRADINVSIRLVGQTHFNPKVEIKNVNSINNVVNAINYEVERQIGLMLSGQTVKQETRRYDEQTKTTVFMRDKEDALNYMYYHDANIVSIKMSDTQFELIKKEKQLDPDQVVEILAKQGLNNDNIQILLNDYELYTFFDYIQKNVNNATLVFNWIAIELLGMLNKKNWIITNLSSEFSIEFIKMLKLLISQDINNKQAKAILEHLLTDSKPVDILIKELGFEQIKDENLLTNLINEIIHSHPNEISEYEARPEKVMKLVIGLVMQKTKAQANPQITASIAKKILDNKK